MIPVRPSYRRGDPVFFLLIPVMAVLGVIVVVGPALLPGVVVLGLGAIVYHFIAKHHDRGIQTH
jgi:uncharacterized protein YqgC (DUF456 family)